MFVELARRLPQYRFHLVGGDPQQGNLYLEQLRVLGPRGPESDLARQPGQDETLGLFDRARLLVNTSEIEGLPNTFYRRGCARSGRVVP